MALAVSTTRWRDQPIIPKDWEDVASLVKVAREVRDRIVEFDWAFTRGDLRSLRRGVYEWGIRTVGRYKCFDARVLAAVNEALGETDTTFVLQEPKNSQGSDCNASCVGDGDLFRLRGHAPFDIVFGYGSAGVGQNLAGSALLGPTVQKTLTDAVGMLDWDLRRLQEERFRPVRNALYGLRLDYGPPIVESSHGPEMDIEVHFHGPFSALDDLGCRCLFADEMTARSGVYLWTINVNGKERPWYVGQTRRGFGQRMGEHLAGFLSGQYTTYDPAALSRGEHRLASGAVKGMWPQTFPSVLRNYESLMPNITGLIRLIKFHLAPLVGAPHLHDRVEGAIGRYYKAHRDPELREFFSPGLKLPAAIPYDNPIRLVLSSETPLAGLPSEIRE